MNRAQYIVAQLEKLGANNEKTYQNWSTLKAQKGGVRNTTPPGLTLKGARGMIYNDYEREPHIRDTGLGMGMTTRVFSDDTLGR